MPTSSGPIRLRRKHTELIGCSSTELSIPPTRSATGSAQIVEQWQRTHCGADDFHIASEENYSATFSRS